MIKWLIPIINIFNKIKHLEINLHFDEIVAAQKIRLPNLQSLKILHT